MSSIVVIRSKIERFLIDVTRIFACTFCCFRLNTLSSKGLFVFLKFLQRYFIRNPRVSIGT